MASPVADTTVLVIQPEFSPEKGPIDLSYSNKACEQKDLSCPCWTSLPHNEIAVLKRYDFDES